MPSARPQIETRAPDFPVRTTTSLAAPTNEDNTGCDTRRMYAVNLTGIWDREIMEGDSSWPTVGCRQEREVTTQTSPTERNLISFPHKHGEDTYGDKREH